MAGEVEDRTSQEVDGSAAEGKEKPSVTDNDAGDGQPKSGKAEAAQQLVDGILEKYDLENPEALGDFLDGLVGLKAKIGDQDVDELIDARDTLIQYHTTWAQQEEARKRENETPEETIDRLSKEIKKRDDVRTREKQAEQEARENEKLIRGFNTFVSREVKALPAIGSHLKPFLTKFLGVDNPIHDHDLSDKEGIRKLVADAGAEMMELEKAILKKHGFEVKDDGTVEKPAGQPAGKPTPTVTTDGEAVSDGTAEGTPKVKNLKEARRSAGDFLRSRLSGGK